MQYNNLKLSLIGLALVAVAACADTSPRNNRQPPTVDAIFAQMDSNQDGKLSKTEIKGPLQNDFVNIDTNGDGYISKAELSQAPRPPQRPPQGGGMAGSHFGRATQTTSKAAAVQDVVTIAVNPAYFIDKGLVEPITWVSCKLSDGTNGVCYKIVTKNVTTDHAMGPWCPNNISDDASQGGIWLKDNKVYDVDGKFIKNLADFYNDGTWKMYDRQSGKINVTKNRTECAAAARPDVDEKYHNYCVQCLPSYVGDLVLTYYLPVKPIKAAQSVAFGHGPHSATPSVRGIAFNGIRFEAHAPVDAILDAHTLAPFDDAGGHINLHVGYHYHAATGKTKEIAQSDGHAPMIGYALDGYGIYANLDVEGNEASDLDENRGHYDAIRGYHYHVDKVGSNNFINGLRGIYAQQPVQ